MVTFYKAPRRSNQALKRIKALSIKGYDHQLRGIANYQGKPLFVTGALDSEQVDVDVYRQSAKKGDAVVKQVVEASDHRINPKCQHFLQCGGCQLQMMPSEHQRKVKTQQFADQLQHHLGISLTPETVYDQAYSYRRRVRMQVSNTHHLSFKAIDGKAMVPVNHCPIMELALESLIVPINAWLHEHRPAVSHIELLSSGGSICLVVRHVKAIVTQVRESLAQRLTNVDCWFKADKMPVFTDVQNQTVSPSMHYDLVFSDHQVTLNYQPHHFVQANAAVNQKMVQLALDWLSLSSSHTVLDLFAGMGNFSLAFASSGAKVIAVEVSEDMVAQGRYNAQTNGLSSLEWHAQNLSEVKGLAPWLASADVVVIDPPRAGANAVISQLVTARPARILSVSCNPATFIRDAKPLVEAGYRLTKCVLIDMFAQTAHSEVMALFECG